MERRDFLRLAALAGATLPAGAVAAEPGSWARLKADAASYRAHAELMYLTPDLEMHGSEKIALVLYPGFTALDLVGPQYFLASLLGAELRLVTTGDTLDPVATDTGLAVVPTHTLANCPADLDVLFVPGSAAGVARALRDTALIDFLRTRGARARFVTSVCTGSLLLGKAGLLKGRRATSHWVTLPLLSRFGAEPVAERIVWDGNIVTGGGVTAGIDFALALVARLRGEGYAKALQLQAEYAPAPPFDAGSPAKADPRLAANIRAMFAPVLLDIEAGI
jgi:cyclohexyl-isocyanide hydratase